MTQQLILSLVGIVVGVVLARLFFAWWDRPHW